MNELDPPKDHKKKTGFFDYFHRAQNEGLTDTEAYAWAITEDLYDAAGTPLSPGEATADGMCCHPDFALRNQDGDKTGLRRRLCEICGTLVIGPHRLHGLFSGPTKIMTRSEEATFCAKLMGALTS